MMRWARRALRRWNIYLPYQDVVCPEYLKAIRIDPDGRATITIHQKLVFLKVPERGDLRDTCTVDSDMTFETFIPHSPDAIEVGRRRTARGAISVDWVPRSPIKPYALYQHERSWCSAGSQIRPAMCTEFHCESKTGEFVFEMITPHSFEAAVVFERPKWTLLNTERRLVRYALQQLEGRASQPSILDHGQRVEWKMMGPKVGVRYVCVVFHINGIVEWKHQLTKSSLFGGMRQLVARLAPR